MFQPVRHFIQAIRDFIQRSGSAFNQLRSSPIDTLSNPYATLASIIAMFGAFVADSLGAGYLIVFAMALLVFLFGLLNEARKADIYQHQAIPLPVVINVSNPASSENALTALFGIIETDRRFHNHRHNLGQCLKILPSELVFNYRGDIHRIEQLQDFLTITRYNLERLKEQTPKNTIIHLAYIGPASVGILIGTMLGLDGVTIYQYEKSADSYCPVIEIRDRSVKEDVSTYEKFEVVKSAPSQPRVTVAIDVAAHKIRLTDPAITQYGDVIYLKSKSVGTITANEDWLQYCREVLKVLNYAQQHYEEIQLVYSIPVALAIAIGIATQNYWNILLTNYDSKTSSYQPLVKLNQIHYFF